VYDADQPQNLCTCGTPLLVDYDLDAMRVGLTPADLLPYSQGMWRYAPLLPVRDPANVVTLGEGGTPTLRAPRAGASIGLDNLYIKDEGINPTGTFKARGASAGVSRAKELGIPAVAMPTAGNAGGAWAADGARAGIEVHVAMPKDAPAINQQEVARYGGHLTLVDGLISDAGRIIGAEAKQHGWFDVATLKEPYRIEGKKTMGLELADAWGWQTLPDVVIYPAGGGVGIIGIWKAFNELRAIGWTDAPLPRLVIVQAAGCAPLVRAWDEGAEVSVFWEGASTVASGLRVHKALGEFVVLQALR
jgi:threonine synthase